MKKNKGYTLIEMLIVLAIMAILSGLAAVSVGLIRKAKIQDAITTFDSQLSNLWMQTKAVSSKQQSMYGELAIKDGEYTFIINDSGSAIATEKYERWSKYIDLDYVGTDGTSISFTDGSTSSVKIQFDKATGGVVGSRGAGDYIFKDKSGKVVATVHLDPITGNHYLK